MPRRRLDEGRPKRRPRPRNEGPKPRRLDGIKARNQEGNFGSSWWAKRWIDTLERLGYGKRMARGQEYARNGAVMSLDLTLCKVEAKVQGSRPQPYRVSIGVPPLSDNQWERAIDAMAEQALFSAKLLEGEMPNEIEEAFAAARVPLFPRNARHLMTKCSCPDEANPCKHIAAVYYLLGERFDEDPFLLFMLRGRTREQIVEALRGRRAAAAPASASAPQLPAEPAGAVSLASQTANFYEAGPDIEQIQAQIAAPPVDVAILKRHGAAPASTDAELRAVYRAMTAGAKERVFGRG